MGDSTAKASAVSRQRPQSTDEFSLLEKKLQDQCVTPTNTDGGPPETQLVHFYGPSAFTMEDLLHAEEADVLGTATYGTMYKVMLEDRSLFAIRRLSEKMTKGHKEFKAKAEELGNIRHRNLLSLRAYYMRSDERLIVTDYMPKGSLCASLRGRSTLATPVDWVTRMTIAKGTARALTYLHDDMNIIHGNLTARTVLLDEQYNPKVTDFGLFRLMTTATNSRVLDVARAMGYCAPELSNLMEASARTEVYSLGIIILELITGMSPRRMDVPQWVECLLREERSNQVIDPKLIIWGEDAGDELVSTLMLALQCTDPSPTVRPQAREVLEKLEKIHPGPLLPVRMRRRRELEHPEQIRLVKEDGAGLSEQHSPLVLEHIRSRPEHVQEAMEQPGQIEGRDVFQQLEYIRLEPEYGANHRLNGHVDDQSFSKWRQRPEDLFKEGHRMDHSGSGLPRDIPFRLLEEITDGFSKERKLGSGAFGEVYKATIDTQTVMLKQGTFRNGNVIAVKKLSQMILDNDDQFQKEVNYLLNLNHQNIVQLIGYCNESKYVSVKLGERYVVAEEQQRLLCFEYLNNRSLREHISDESCGLEWHIKYEVIRGICCGLHYLHTECNMVHLDLKPTNILLDHSMVPKVADFGISRLFGDQKSRTITHTIMGTFGYMAPEYINNGLISYKADIFSLGVIIIEVMTRCRDYPYSTGSEGSSVPFTEKVIANWRKRFETKARHISEEKYIEQVKTCITIGLMCVNPEPNERPSVGDINRMLNIIIPQT